MYVRAEGEESTNHALHLPLFASTLRKQCRSSPSLTHSRAFLTNVQGVCMEAGMYALRERRVHVTQEDFEMAVSKIMQKDSEKNVSLKKFWK